MDLKKASVEGKMLNVVDYDSYSSNRELYENNLTAVELRKGQDSFILPSRTGNSLDKPGVYNCGAIDLIVYPTTSKKEFQPDVVNLSDAKTIAEYISKSDQVKDMTREILTSPDNVFVPPLYVDDSPEMRGLKDAVIAKKVDIDKYADRFGENFPNDKRKFKDKNTTLFIIKRMCKHLDMKAKLYIEDADENVPNPIGHPIVVDLTGGYDDDAE